MPFLKQQLIKVTDINLKNQEWLGEVTVRSPPTLTSHSIPHSIKATKDLSLY